jgi:DNA modification methylase
MKAVGGPRTDKQRGHSRRHSGFNDRWDSMEKSEQCSGRVNKRDVWTIAPANFKGAHFATYPPKLIEPCILAGCPAGGTVLDPFNGSGTTGLVALQHGRNYIGADINEKYLEMSSARLAEVNPLFTAIGA